MTRGMADEVNNIKERSLTRDGITTPLIAQITRILDSLQTTW